MAVKIAEDSGPEVEVTAAAGGKSIRVRLAPKIPASNDGLLMGSALGGLLGLSVSALGSCSTMLIGERIGGLGRAASAPIFEERCGALALAETVGADETSDPTSLRCSENVASEAAASARMGGSSSLEKPGDGQLAAAASSAGGGEADADEGIDTELGTTCLRPRGRAAVSALVAAILESSVRDGAGEAATASGASEREDVRRVPRSEAAHMSTGARPRQCAVEVRPRQSERSRSRSRRGRAAGALISAIRGEEHVEVQPPARRADVQMLTHNLLASSTVTWCRVCGAYADSRTRGILRRCPGPPGRGGSGRTSLRRLLAGRHPRTNEVLPGRALSLRATF